MGAERFAPVSAFFSQEDLQPRLYQMGCSATAKDELVKRAEARIFWARAEINATR
jgi:hypothetical protein